MGGKVGFHSGLGASPFFSGLLSDERSWWKKTKDKWFGERVLIVVIRTKVIDISPLAELKNLKVLLLFNAPLTNRSPLTELKTLEMIALSPAATEEQAQELILALPNLNNFDLGTDTTSNFNKQYFQPTQPTLIDPWQHNKPSFEY